MADKPLTLVTWDVDAVTKMASGAAGFAVPGYWRSFALFTVSAAFAMHEGVRPHNHMVRFALPGFGCMAYALDVHHGLRPLCASWLMPLMCISSHGVAYVAAQGEDEVDGWEMGAMSSDFSAPLTEEEQAEVRPPFKVCVCVCACVCVCVCVYMRACMRVFVCPSSLLR